MPTSTPPGAPPTAPVSSAPAPSTTAAPVPEAPEGSLHRARAAVVAADVPADVSAARAFAPVPGYLNAATLGLPPRAVTSALQDAVKAWSRGEACAVGYDSHVQRARELYADLVDAAPADVAVGSQTSVLVGLVAAALPEDCTVVVVEGDFSSVVYPFMAHADRGVRVVHTPLHRLAETVADIRPAAVAYSMAQSSTGELAAAEDVRRAAADVGALTVCDLTQSAGWLPARAGDDDVTVCSAYKWLCQPRGTAYLTVRPEVRDRLRPLNAGWYAGASIWDSCYGPQMDLAPDARRFDVSPAWLSWVGAVPALELFTSSDADVLRTYGSRLADLMRAELGHPLTGRPVVSLPDPGGDLARRLEAAGCRVAGRAGRVRVAFHLWNTQDDVDRAVGALRGRPWARPDPPPVGTQ